MHEIDPLVIANPPAPLPSAALLRQALRQAAVSFCHWKSNHHLAAALAGDTDIDLFVAPADRTKFERVVVAIKSLRMLSQPWSRYPDVEDWLLFDEVTGGFLHLHVHYALMTGLKCVKHLHIPWEAALLDHLRTDETSGWPIPTVEMELSMLLVRIWAKMPPWRRLTGPVIPGHILEELDWLRSGVDPQKLADLAERLGFQAEEALLLELLQKRRMPAGGIIALARALYRELRSHRRMPWPSALAVAAGRNVRLVLAHACRRLRRTCQAGKTIPEGGLMIAVVGTDGSGKSTIARDTEKWLRFKLDAHTLYMGSGDGGDGLFDMLRRGIRGLARSAGPRMKRPGGGGGSNGRNSTETFLAKLLQLHQLVLMRHKLRLLRVGRRLAQAGSIILTDRYPQIQFYGISDGPKLQNGRSFAWAARSELKLHQEAARLGPDLVLKLSIDPHTAQLRKPDHSFSTIERKCAVVGQLSFPSSRVVEIDARQDCAAVLLAAKRAIWAELMERRS